MVITDCFGLFFMLSRRIPPMLRHRLHDASECADRPLESMRDARLIRAGASGQKSLCCCCAFLSPATSTINDSRGVSARHQITDDDVPLDIVLHTRAALCSPRSSAQAVRGTPEGDGLCRIPPMSGGTLIALPPMEICVQALCAGPYRTPHWGIPARHH